MKKISIVFIITVIVLVNSSLNARENKGLSKGQTVYVPAYSHIYTGNKEVPSLLAVTLSIRNTDPNHPIQILVVDYYETHGKLLKKYISSALTLDAMGTKHFTIPAKDKAGGSGANFIVEWKAEKPVNLPIIETIMIGSRSSFTSQGQEIYPSD